MKLENNFTIDAPVEKAWEALNSPETVAPCFPGATLTEYEGDSFTGTVKVKLGPISMTYKGKGTYVSRDEAAHEVVIDASGRDSRGNGTANATVTATLGADGPDRTTVSMVTDMTITGKPAQFGRGVISDVADKIIGQFSACVARKLAPSAEAPASDAASTAASPASSTAASTAAEPVSASAGTSEVEAPASTAMAPETPSFPPSTSAGASEASEVEAPASTAMKSETPSVPASASSNGTSEVEAPASTAMTRSASSASSPASASTDTSAGRSQAQAPASTTMTTPSSVKPSPTPRAPVRSEVDAIDLLDTAGAPVLKRVAPVAGGAVLLLLIVLLVRRLRG
jgi:uncharacterized protein